MPGIEPPIDSPMVCATCGEPAACYHTDGQPFCTAHCALGHRIGPPSDSVDDIVDAYYDTGAYLADPTRPGATIEPPTDSPRARHPVTGRFLAFDCERDCLEHCAGLCGVFVPDQENAADDASS